MRRLLLTALLVVAVLLAACSDDDDDQHAASKPTTTSSSTSTTMATTTSLPHETVGAVGDSLLFQVQEALPADAPELQVFVEGIVGLTANDAIPAVERVLSHAPVAVAVSLGTNDARDGATSDNDLAAIRRVARRLGDVRCVVWATVNDRSRFSDMNAEAREINAELARQAANRPNLRIVPWADELAAHPEWLDEDGIHHSLAGQRAFAHRLATDLRACVGGR